MEHFRYCSIGEYESMSKDQKEDYEARKKAFENSDEQIWKRRVERFKSWNIPPGFYEAVRKPSWQNKQILEQAGSWLEGGCPFLLLHGSNGTGKTVLACKLMSHWYEETLTKDIQEYQKKNLYAKGLPSHLVRIPKFVKQISSYQDYLEEARSGSVRELHRDFFKSDLLVIDDLGVKAPTEGYREWLFNLIDQRMDYQKKTIITTNQNSESMRHAYGEAFLSRILKGLQVEMNGKDFRRG